MLHPCVPWGRRCGCNSRHLRLQPPLPACLLGYLSAMRERIEEELAWVVNSSIFRRMLDANDRLHELEQGSHPPSSKKPFSSLHGMLNVRTHMPALPHADDWHF